MIDLYNKLIQFFDKNVRYFAFIGIPIIFFMIYYNQKEVALSNLTIQESITEQDKTRQLLWSNLLLQRTVSFTLMGKLTNEKSYFKSAEIFSDNLRDFENLNLDHDLKNSINLFRNEIVNSDTHNKFNNSLWIRSEDIGKKFNLIESKSWFDLKERNEKILNSIKKSQEKFFFLLLIFSLYIVLLFWIITKKEKISLELIIKSEELAKQQIYNITSSKLVSLGEMASGVAHEINNPLGIIQGKSLQLSRRIQKGKADLDEIKLELDKIIEMSDRISSIVKGLRSFSRNAEKDPYAAISLEVLIDHVLSLCVEKFKVNNVDLKISTLPEISVECRATQIEQVLINLLNNSFYAVKNLKDKWISVEVTVFDNNLRLSVTDSGDGISPEILDKLMQPFFTTKEVGQGTGLGLSISKGIIEDHHGTLRYDPTSANTRFIIELPQTQIK